MRALALTYLSADLFILGHTDEALSRGEEAIAWSRKLNHPHTLGYALSFGALVRLLRRENEKAEAMTEEVLALVATQNLPVWLPSANVMRGHLRVARGDTEALAFARQGIAAKNAQGSVLNQPLFLSLLAASCEGAGKPEEALSLLAEAFAIAERTGERWFEAELYRLRGDWLLVTATRRRPMPKLASIALLLSRVSRQRKYGSCARPLVSRVSGAVGGALMRPATC